MSKVTQPQKREAIYTALDISFPTSTDFFSDLNACHAAELALSDEQHAEFRRRLYAATHPDNAGTGAHERAYISATAEQHAAALYLAITQTT